jgi:hypothetical protein
VPPLPLVNSARDMAATPVNDLENSFMLIVRRPAVHALDHGSQNLSLATAVNTTKWLKSLCKMAGRLNSEILPSSKAHSAVRSER